MSERQILRAESGFSKYRKAKGVIETMSFFSFKFLIFLIIVFIIYYIIPKRLKNSWLLIASYVFYASWNLKYSAVLLFITLISYATALTLPRMRKGRKWLLSLGIAVSLVTLCVFKFWEFWMDGLRTIFGISDPATGGIISIAAPIGLSFFVLTAIGYMVDVYRGKYEPESNCIRYALFISFFPNIMSGPIERGSNLLKQIQSDISFEYDTVKHGLMLMLWGYFLKCLIANRAAVIVDAAFGSYVEQTGFTMLFAVFLYGIQLYADFAGYSYIALGIAETFGYHLLVNFRQPYFALDMKDFWSRWHISLSTWLKDYVYIPLGGNRKGKVRQYLNLFITFLVSGIWHGNGWTYMIWGCIHGLYQVLERLIYPLRKAFLDKSHIKTDCFSYRFFHAIPTFLLVDFAWLFFRSPSAQDAVAIIKQIAGNFQFQSSVTEKLFLVGCDQRMLTILVVELLALLLVDLLHESKISIMGWLNRQNKLFRWILYLSCVLILLIGMIHDYGLDASTFIYAQF